MTELGLKPCLGENTDFAFVVETNALFVEEVTALHCVAGGRLGPRRFGRRGNSDRAREVSWPQAGTRLLLFLLRSSNALVDHKITVECFCLFNANNDATEKDWSEPETSAPLSTYSSNFLGQQDRNGAKRIPQCNEVRVISSTHRRESQIQSILSRWPYYKCEYSLRNKLKYYS